MELNKYRYSEIHAGPYKFATAQKTDKVKQEAV